MKLTLGTLGTHSHHFSFGTPGCAFVAVLLALMCVAASCGPARPIGSGPRCAFSDPEFTTSLGICNIVAEYYVANHEWPLNCAQLEEQWRKMLEQTKNEIPPEEAKELSAFFERFTRLDLRKQGNDLIFHFRFKTDGPAKTIDQTVTFKPGASADEILRAASGGAAD